MNDALEIYKDSEKVMHIAGYMFPVNGELPETFFLRSTSCWGWATWKRAWDSFESDEDKLLLQFSNKKERYEFDIMGSNEYYAMLKKQAAGKVDSWAIRWYASIFLEKGLCLHPGKSLVNNIGHDMTGMHCTSTDIYNVDIDNKRVEAFSDHIVENFKVVNLMSDFYRASRKGLWLKVVDKIKRISTHLKAGLFKNI